MGGKSPWAAPNKTGRSARGSRAAPASSASTSKSADRRGSSLATQRGGAGGSNGDSESGCGGGGGGGDGDYDGSRGLATKRSTASTVSTSSNEDLGSPAGGVVYKTKRGTCIERSCSSDSQGADGGHSSTCGSVGSLEDDAVAGSNSPGAASGRSAHGSGQGATKVSDVVTEPAHAATQGAGAMLPARAIFLKREVV